MQPMNHQNHAMLSDLAQLSIMSVAINNSKCGLIPGLNLVNILGRGVRQNKDDGRMRTSATFGIIERMRMEDRVDSQTSVSGQLEA